MLLATVLGPVPLAARAQAALVIETRGASIVERSGQAPRLLGAGEKLDQRDTINVARESWAILEFDDQTRITLRPNTVFRLDTYRAGEPASMAVGLVKGGLRAVTDDFGKRHPPTEFDARLCEQDCALEERSAPAPRPLFSPIARVVEMYGSVAAARLGEGGRTLSAGAIIYEGDAIGTARDSYVVLAFVDGAQLSLGHMGSIAIHTYIFDPAAPAAGGAQISLVAGDIELAGGVLAFTNAETFLIDTPMGLLRARRTDAMPSSCFGSDCAKLPNQARRDPVESTSWVLVAQRAGDTVMDVPAPMLLAQAMVTAPPGEGLQNSASGQWTVAVEGAIAELAGQGTIGDGETLQGADGQPAKLVKGRGPTQSTVVPLNRVKIDPSMFDGGSKSVAPGLYVWVRDGGITLDKGGNPVDVPAGNAAVATIAGVGLLDAVPNFMRFDTTPLPDRPAGDVGADLFRAADGSNAAQCTVPGAAITGKGNGTEKAAPVGAIREGMSNVLGGAGASANIASGIPQTGNVRSGREQAFDNAGRGADSDSSPRRFSFRDLNGPTSSGRVVRGDSFATGLANRNAQSGDVGLGQGRSNFTGAGRGNTSSGGSDTPPSGTSTTTVPITNGDTAGVATGAASGTVLGPSGSTSQSSAPLVGNYSLTTLASATPKDSNADRFAAARVAGSYVTFVVHAPKPRDDENISGGGSGTPVYMRRGPQPEGTLVQRALDGRRGAGDANDGRTNQQQTTGNGGGVMTTDREKQGGLPDKAPSGALDLDEVLRLDRLVNPGAR